MKLSAVIPCFSVTEELKDMALKCAKSIRDQVDELIIAEDADIYWHDLHQISDVYVVHPRLDYKKNCNLGWKLATGDFVLQANSDSFLIEGNLQDLCIDGIGIAWCEETGNEIHLSQAMGAFFVTPRSFFEQLGGWDNVKEHVWDFSLFNKLSKLGAPQTIRSVRISHPRAGATSYNYVKDYNGRPGSIDKWTEEQKQKQLAHEEAFPAKEIDWARHQQRMIEDLVYAKRWQV